MLLLCWQQIRRPVHCRAVHRQLHVHPLLPVSVVRSAGVVRHRLFRAASPLHHLAQVRTTMFIRVLLTNLCPWLVIAEHDLGRNTVQRISRTSGKSKALLIRGGCWEEIKFVLQFIAQSDILSCALAVYVLATIHFQVNIIL